MARPPRLYAALLAAALALPAPALAEDAGFLTRQLQDLLSDGGREVRIRGFEGALSSRATIAEMTIADDDGVWLTLRDAQLDWNRGALLRRALQVNALTAREIIVERLPDTGPGAPPSPEATPFALPELPLSVDIGRIEAATVQLGAPLLGQPVTVRLDGSAQLSGGAGRSRLEVVRIDDAEGALRLAGSFSNVSRELALDVALREGPDGIVANALGLPDSPSLGLEIAGDGPLSDFAARIALETEDTPRLTGQVALSRESADTQSFRADLSGDVRPLFAPDFRGFFGPETRLEVAGSQPPDGRVVLSRIALSAEELDLAGQVELAASGLPERIALQGRVGTADGRPVLLPLAGPRTSIDGLALTVDFDATRGDDWRADIVLDGLERPDFAARRLALTGTGQIVETPRRITGALRLAAEGLAPADPDLAAALGPSLAGSLGIDWREGAPLRLQDLDLSGVDYGLAGALEVEGQTLSADVTARLEDLGRFAGLAGRPLSGAAEAAITGSAALLDGAFDVRLSALTRDLTLDIPEADALLAGTARLQGGLRRDADGTAVDDLTVQAQTLSARLDGVLRSTGSELSATLDFADLAVLGPDYGGRLLAEARLTGAGDLQRLEATAIGRDLALGIAELDGLLSGESRIEAAASFGPDVLFLDSFSLGATTLAVTAEGRLGAAGTDLTGRLDFADLGVLGPGWGGQLSGDARLLEAEGERRLRLDAAARDISAGIEALDAALAGDSRLALEALQDAAGIDIARLDLRTDSGLTADGAGRIAPEGSDFSGRIGLADLGVLGAGLAGRIAAEASVSDRQGTQALRARATADDLGTGVAELDRLLAGQTRIDLAAALTDGVVTLEALQLDTPGGLTASASGRLQDGDFDLDATAALPSLTALAPQFGGGLLAEAQLTGRGALRRLQASATARDLSLGVAELDRLLAGETAITLSAAAEEAVVTLESLQLAGDTGLSASASGRLAEGDGALDIDAVLASLAALGPGYGGRLAAQAALREQDETRSLELSAQGQDLASGIFELDRLLRGRSEVTLQAEQLGERLRVREARLSTPLLTAQADATVDGDRRRLDLQARLADLGALVAGLDGPATLAGSITDSDAAAQAYAIDLSATGPGGIDARVTGRMARDLTAALAIAGSGNLALVNRFSDAISVQGPVRFDLRLDGPPGLEALSGTASTEGARVVTPQAAVTLESLAANARLDDGTVTLQADARVQDGGRIAAGGTVGLGPGLPAALTVDLMRARITDRRIFETRISGGLAIDGPLTGGGRIGGDLSLEDTEVRIPSTGLGVGGYTPPGIVHIGESAAARLTRLRAGVNGAEEDGGGGGAPFDLDLTLASPNRLFIRGRGLDAEMGGSLRLTGTTADVVPAGEFTLIRGRLDLLGRRFVLSDGAARLTGRFVPFITLTATTQTDGITAAILVEGEADALGISFQSVPELPEEEVVALILFGRGLDRLTPFQAAQLASAVATLAGRGGEGVVGNLRRGFGLDDLDVSTTDDGLAAVRLGRYLTDNVYTDILVDSEGRSEVSINLDVTSSVTVRGRTDSEGRSGIGIFFERDY